MQAKHLWYNVDIRWVDLKDKLGVLAPTGLTRDDIWRHLFLTKQRKNPYEEGYYTGEDLEDVKRKWEAKKEYFLQYKKMAATLLALTWPWHFKALTLTTLQRIMQLKTQKHYILKYHALFFFKLVKSRINTLLNPPFCTSMADKRRYLPYQEGGSA